ncbi:ArsR family transcriptional regulator [Rothia sp. AR01]|uniref:ArsR family transcriptional regulator n=1 Tax=Rothia santali TaxID=2949643 RepID=A0A9X2KHH7_9MICC|nr:ArsR family transcriptional regulator [Rothia santali]MCP3425183.1 ArsR family transcriptional regulator [Rothia santali]
MKPVEDQSPEVLAAVYSFGNALRLAIIRRLQDGPKFRAEIIGDLDVSWTSASHQLQYLREQGLVIAEQVPGVGRPVRYSLDPERVDEVLQAFLAYFRGDSLDAP